MMKRAPNNSLILLFEHPNKNEAVYVGQRTPYSKYNVRYRNYDEEDSIKLGKYDTLEEVLECIKKIENRPWFYKKAKEEFNI